MPVHVQINQNHVFKVTIWSYISPRTFTLDMSLKRHSYRYIEDSKRKPMNSVLYASVTDAAIQADLLDLGRQVKDRFKHKQTSYRAPRSLEFKINMVREAMDLGHNIRTSTNIINDSLFGDYLVASGRTYQVDNSAFHMLQDVTHCFPKAGPDLWAQVNLDDFNGAASFRHLEKKIEEWRNNFQNRQQSPLELWLSLYSASTLPPMKSDLKKAFTSAKTYFCGLIATTQQKIVEVAGNTWLHKDMLIALRHVP